MASHHAHLDAEVLELFLDQAAGHLQRFGRHGLLALQGAVEQVHLRQLAVGQFGEQGLLLSLATRSLLGTSCQHRLDQHRRRMVLLDFLALVMHHLFALARGLLAQRQVLSNFAALRGATRPGHPARTHALGHMAPGKPEHQRTPPAPAPRCPAGPSR
jgi:hypothetical protein